MPNELIKRFLDECFRWTDSTKHITLLKPNIPICSLYQCSSFRIETGDLKVPPSNLSNLPNENEIQIKKLIPAFTLFPAPTYLHPFVFRGNSHFDMPAFTCRGIFLLLKSIDVKHHNTFKKPSELLA